MAQKSINELLKEARERIRLAKTKSTIRVPTLPKQVPLVAGKLTSYPSFSDMENYLLRKYAHVQQAKTRLDEGNLGYNIYKSFIENTYQSDIKNKGRRIKSN